MKKIISIALVLISLLTSATIIGNAEIDFNEFLKKYQNPAEEISVSQKCLKGFYECTLDYTGKYFNHFLKDPDIPFPYDYKEYSSCLEKSCSKDDFKNEELKRFYNNPKASLPKFIINPQTGQFEIQIETSQKN